MAAKHGAQSRLNAANAAMAAVPPPSMVAKPCHRAGSVSPASPKLVRMPTVATTFSLATSPVMDVTADSQFPKPSGANTHAKRLPKAAMRL